MSKFIASYDFGTSSCKLAIVDMKGNVRGSATVEYPVIALQTEWAEQNPDEYWNAACVVTRKALANAEVEPVQVCGIVFATIWKGIIPLDKHDRPLRNSILWRDGRAEREAAWLNEQLGVSSLSHKDYWPKLLWYRQNEPRLYEQTQMILDVSSYVKFLATGIFSQDMSNHFTRSFDSATQSVYTKMLHLSDIDVDLFPPIVKQTEQVGTLTNMAASDLGLMEGTPVFGGCTDVMAITVGSGATECNDANVYLGTSGWYAQATPYSKRIDSFLIAPYTTEVDITMYGLNAACTAVDWAISCFYPEQLEKVGKEFIYSLLERELSDIPAGSDSLVATSWIFGERPPVHKDSRGLFINITGKHDRRHFVNAIRESEAYMLKWKREITEQVSGIRPERIRAVGGGSLSTTWMQILADVLETTIEIPKSPQFAGAIGAAACALVGLGELKSLSEIKEIVEIQQYFNPNANHVERYHHLYDTYRQLHVLNPLFSKLNSIL